MKVATPCIMAASAVAALAAIGYFIAGSRGDVLDDGSIELVPSTNFFGLANTGSPKEAPKPRGQNIRFSRKLTGVVNVQNGPDIGGSLIVYFQSSADNGQTWQDFASVYTTNTGTNTYLAPVVLYCDSTSFPTAPTLVNSAVLGNNIIAPTRGIARRIRAIYQATYGPAQGPTTAGNWNFNVTIKPD